MNKNIFLVGPSSVGKTTIGNLLANEMGWQFIDVDKEFCEQIELIPQYIKKHSYAGYSEANSKLVDRLIKKNSERTVFATPSGYLVHEDSPHLVEKHLGVIKSGTSILLLPSRNLEEGTETIVQRQLNRWDDVSASEERKRFLERFEKYKNYGDIQIFSMGKPEVITRILIEKLSEL